jgi:hypothetical protein
VRVIDSKVPLHENSIRLRDASFGWSLLNSIPGPHPPSLETKSNVNVCSWRCRLLSGKSYPKDDVAKVVPVTPKFTLRRFGIAGARIGLSKIRSIGGGRVGDSEALVGRGWLDDEATCNEEKQAFPTVNEGSPRL